MTSHVVRSLSPFAVATAIVAVSAGSVGCWQPPRQNRRPLLRDVAEITLALDAVDAFGFAFATGDIDTARLLLTQLPEMGEEAVAAAPDDIAETVETWVAPLPLIVAALADVDPSDPDAFEQAVNAIDSRSSETARQEVQAWAEFNCGWTSALVAEQIEAPEPPECEVLDAGAAAEAAGIDVDVTDLDGSADVSLPGFWTKSCSYGNGAMSLSTLSFNTVEDAQRFYADNLELSDGVVLDVDLGSLPESSLVIQTGVTHGHQHQHPGDGRTRRGGDTHGPGQRVRSADPVLGVVHRRRRRPGRRGRCRRSRARRPRRHRTASDRRGDDCVDLPDAAMDGHPRSRCAPGHGDAAPARAEHGAGRTSS